MKSSSIPTVILILLVQVASNCSAFVVFSPGRHTAACVASLAAASSSEQASDELISLLLARRRTGKSTKGNDDAHISSLVETLTSAKVEFDPTECFDGPLFVSNVLDGSTPLWERFGIKFGRGNNNLQGQQYRYTSEDKSVVNYAEIFGKEFHVRAYGTFEQSRSTDTTAEVDGAAPAQTSLLDGLLSIFGTALQQQQQQRATMLQCPADFTVTVTKGSFFVFGNRIDIPISGTGFLRVLYADPKLRLFLSPKSTTDDRWEKAGLKVAQIRADLVQEGGFEDLFDDEYQ